MQIMKLTQKWVFDGQTRPKKIWILKDQIGLIWGESDGRRREEEEEEEKKKGREEEKRSQASQGMETHFDYEFYVSMYEFPCWVG